MLSKISNNSPLTMGKMTINTFDETTLEQSHIHSNQDSIIKEYDELVAKLKEELHHCKNEENRLKSQLISLRDDGQKDAGEIQKMWMQFQYEMGRQDDQNKEMIGNLEEKVTVLQMEKDSVYQLWQMALKAIEVLEGELKLVHRQGSNDIFFQEQINSINDSYSEAIKLLETKLIEAKESFFQSQAEVKSNRHKLEFLVREKSEWEQKLQDINQKLLAEKTSHKKELDLLQDNMNNLKNELAQLKESKLELENKLIQVNSVNANIALKENEAKSKVSEALDLIEEGLKEKEEILKRESKLTEEIAKLQSNLENLSQENEVRLQGELLKAKALYDKNVKKYTNEIRGLRAKLREINVTNDRLQREYKLIEEELEKLQKHSEIYVKESEIKISSLEKILEIRNNNVKGGSKFTKIYEEKIQYLEHQIIILEEKLLNNTEKLKQANIQNSREIEDHIKQAEERTREISDKYLNLERRLSKALSDKETLTLEMQALHNSFEKEIQKRNHEKIILESKLRDLEQVSRNTISKDNIKVPGTSVEGSICRPSTQYILKEKYESDIKELKHHVESYQQMSNRWKEEVNLLTTKFQKRTKEFQSKIIVFQKQNEELTRELMFHQRYNSQIIQNNDLEKR